MTALQYHLFEENSEICLLKREVEEIKHGCDNVRKGIFARHNEMMKLLMKQQEEIDQLKSLIGKSQVLFSEECLFPDHMTM
jgi:hypothetical protein